MNQGEIIQIIRVHERQLKILEEQIAQLSKKVYEMDGLLKSPIRRSIYASKNQ